MILPGGPFHHALVPLALRGALSRDALGAQHTLPLGDPGLFAAAMLPGRPVRKGIGIVPHYIDKPAPMVAALSQLPGVRIIDVKAGGMEVVAQIAQCAVVLSSSLHGLVVADALGLPNHRLQFLGRLKGGDHKFLDKAYPFDSGATTSCADIPPIRH